VFQVLQQVIHNLLAQCSPLGRIGISPTICGFWPSRSQQIGPTKPELIADLAVAAQLFTPPLCKSSNAEKLES